MPVVLDNDPGDRVALYAWDGAAWRKGGLPLGYNNVYEELVQNLNAAAGANTLTGSTVPAGEVWVVTSIAAWDSVSAITDIYVEVYDGTNSYPVARLQSPAIDGMLDRQGRWILAAGRRVRAVFSGCVLNDDIRLSLLGYKTDVTP